MVGGLHRDCKNDADKICLVPALTDFNADIIPECRAIRLNGDRNRIRSVQLELKGELFEVKAPLFIVACGAINTPMLLLNSANTTWPTGVANSSELVGKCLMVHCVDLWDVRMDIAIPEDEFCKQLAFNDFYQRSGLKFGTVQSFGKSGLNQSVRFAAIMEDEPSVSNFVAVSRDRGTPHFRGEMHYKISNEDKRKLGIFRNLIRAAFHPYQSSVFVRAEDFLNSSHACGTCRLGEDPTSSVVNVNNRSHDIENLYITDASFFPSSAGTNPSLTIVANAMRVSEHILNLGIT